MKRFRVAFSFAGEKRKFVAKVAAILAQRFGEAAILYDKFHKAEFSRSDLAFYLPELYEKDADLVVAVFCPDYDHKEWCGLEWNAIFGLLKARKAGEVMLTRFQRVEGKGLHGLAGYTDLDDETPESAATLILERLAINEGQPKDHYTKATTTNPPALRSSIPNNLPRLQPFFGRENELTQLREALDPDNRTWGALIDGPGGMGKTSLAVRAAYDCPPGQFQRIIFLSAKDREMDEDGMRPLTGFILPGFLEMLNELARELGQPDIPKAPEDQRIKLLLDALRPAHALLILDNLESLPKSDRDQLFTFVKRLPQGCKAILTSRRRIGSGSEELILEHLDQVAALATLADLARHNKLLAKTSEAERIALYAQTGGKPLLLRWAAGQLGRGSCRTLNDAIAFLRSCPPDNDPLEFIFGDLVEEFTLEETQALCALTYFTMPATVEHIAELAGLKQEPVEVALHSLANRSLVVPDQEDEAFALVPMGVDFLRRARPEVVKQTANRLEERAYSLIMENGGEQFDRFPILAAAWPIVGPAITILLIGPNDRLQNVACALQPFLRNTGRWDEQLALCLEAEKRAVAAKDFFHAGLQAYNVGVFYSSRAHSAEVRIWAERAAAHWKQVGEHPIFRAMAGQLRGIAHYLDGDFHSAGVALREALISLVSPECPRGMLASVRAWLGNVALKSRDLDAAEDHYRKALRESRAIAHAELVAACSTRLASLALARGELSSAETLAREALCMSHKVGDQELIASNCECIARAFARQGKKVEGLPYARRAVEIFTKLGSPELEKAREVLAECEG